MVLAIISLLFDVNELLKPDFEMSDLCGVIPDKVEKFHQI